MTFVQQLSHLLSGTFLFAAAGILAVQGPKLAADPKNLQVWAETITMLGTAWRVRVAIAKSGPTA